ncbi:SprT-like domain-containing protein [Haloferax namakaokahaiae]|uniref:SprT-like domain-containing protein n=1 Tax=Haloferax namakaokahaiae TaxID=1748331 RepID=A0ABD5ZK58_9EURY
MERGKAASPNEFEAIETHTSLVRWSKAYARSAIDNYDFDVSLDAVEWEVSTRAKRRAAAVKSPSFSDAEVGTPRTWNGDGPPSCTMSLSWRAAQSFEYEEWAATLRHELVHVEQFQTFGSTNHGTAFKERADQVDAPVRVRRFSDPKYVLTCTDCGENVAHRYRDCKLVRHADAYRSGCCEAPLRCLEP